MLKIGEFARLGRVPAKTLRYYDEIGLLKPSGIDRWTRYRYYTAEQLPAIERVLALKQLGFTLDEVAYLLRGDVPLADLAGLLRARRDTLRQEIAAAQAGLAQVEAWLDQTEYMSGTKESTMKPDKIIALDRFLTVGMPYLGKNEHNEISQLWGEFMAHIGEIKRMSQPYGSYGICTPNSAGLVDYLAAVPVTNLDDVPAGMVGKEVPAQTYAVFEANGLKDIPKVYGGILNEWLPSSGYAPGDGPDFEYYPPTWQNPESLMYIYYPIKKS